MVTTYNQCCAVPLDLLRTTSFGLHSFLESKELDNEFWFFGKIRMGEPLGDGISKTLKNQQFHERICHFRGNYFISAIFLRTMNIYYIYKNRPF